MYSLEAALSAAQQRGDQQESARLLRLIERLDDQRKCYGTNNR